MTRTLLLAASLLTAASSGDTPISVERCMSAVAAVIGLAASTTAGLATTAGAGLASGVPTDRPLSRVATLSISDWVSNGLTR